MHDFLFVWLVYFNSKVFLKWYTKTKYDFEHATWKHIFRRPGERIHAERGSDLGTQDFFCDNIFD